MDWSIFFGVILIVFIVFLTSSMLYCLLGGADIPYTHMSYDEEIDWLMKEHNMSREEAEEIANLPWK